MLKAGILILLAWIIQTGLIQLLNKTKTYQSIYELSPQSHQNKKKTPSFGGIGIALSVSIGMALFRVTDIKIWWVYCLYMIFVGIGLLDDLLSVFKGKNKGLSAIQKFSLQSIAAIIFVYLFQQWLIPIPVWMSAIYVLIIISASNAANLTDGLDGLLAGLSLIGLIGYACINYQLADIPTTTLSIIYFAAISGFLIVNKHPAKIFMGDTGALGIGAALAGLTIISGSIWLIFPFTAVMIIETLSVIIQVTSFKSTGKRVFLMSPIHHHFELKGMPEQQVVRLFWTIQLICTLTAIAYFNLR